MNKMFRNIGRIRLTPLGYITMVLAFLGSAIAYAGYLWLGEATTQQVNLTANPSIAQIVTPSLATENNRIDVDVALVIDFSGSMPGFIDDVTGKYYPGSDPSNLRLKAAEIMASSLAKDIYPRHTRMGVVDFGTTAYVSQDLTEIESQDAREKIIKGIYTLPTEAVNDKQFVEWTNISDALQKAEDMLFPAKPSTTSDTQSNTPAIILLTDGWPQSANGNVSFYADIDKKIGELAGRGTAIFIVLLRNPKTVNDPQYKLENDQLDEWRNNWVKITGKYPQKVQYFEAQDNSQLAGIYNTIRARLVMEGTPPSTKPLAYNPQDPNASIIIPDNLLQAQLLVNRPDDKQTIDLIAPDNSNFKDIVSLDDKNEIFEGNYFYRFSLYKPAAGAWKLVTDIKQPLYYLLITESLYSTRVYWPVGQPYLLPDKPSTVPFVVTDDQGNIQGNEFHLKAYTLKIVQQPDGSFAEQPTLLADLTPVKDQQGVTTYPLTITPELVNGNDFIRVQVDGEAADGTSVNESLVNIPILAAPSGIKITVPSQVECTHEHLNLWPPKITCSNKVQVSATVLDGNRSASGTLNGTIYSPVPPEETKMTVIDPVTVQGEIGPLPDVGKYGIAVDTGGKVRDTKGNFEWSQRNWATVEVTWPSWVNVMKHRTLYAAILLLLIALWKPVVVSLLLPLFYILRLSPSGFYSESGDSTIPIYPRSMERRKPFTLTVGSGKNANIKVYRDIAPSAYSSKWFGRLKNRIYKWLQNQPLARLVAVPWSGIWIERKGGGSGGFDKASENNSTTVNLDGAKIQVGQKDWTNK